MTLRRDSYSSAKIRRTKKLTRKWNTEDMLFIFYAVFLPTKMDFFFRPCLIFYSQVKLVSVKLAVQSRLMTGVEAINWKFLTEATVKQRGEKNKGFTYRTIVVQSLFYILIMWSTYRIIVMQIPNNSLY